MNKRKVGIASLFPALFAMLLLLSACVRPAPQSRNFLGATATAGASLSLTAPAPIGTTVPLAPGPGPASPTPTPLPPIGEPVTPPEAATPVPQEQAPPPAEGSTDTTSATGETVHIVQAGENLFRIGLRYGFTAQELATYNGIPNMNLIYVGQQIRIPPRP